MATYAHIVFYSLIGGLFSLVGGILLLSNKKLANTLQAYGMPFAAGALLASVFLDLLKDGLEESTPDKVLAATLIGILLFFFAEQFLHWFHHHHQHEGADPTVPLIIVGDTIHNALDGVAIAASFLISIPTGIVTTLAVAAHEIPQEIGDFGLLIAKGMQKAKVLWVNIISALATTAAALITFALGKNSNIPTGILLGMSAGFLLYIAMSDIIPTIHEKAKNKRLFELQPLLMLLGAALVALSVQLAHKYIDHEDAQTTSPSTIHIDAKGIPHGQPGHDHGTMLELDAKHDDEQATH